jgi:hypothetical protein
MPVPEGGLTHGWSWSEVIIQCHGLDTCSGESSSNRMAWSFVPSILNTFSRRQDKIPTEFRPFHWLAFQHSLLAKSSYESHWSPDNRDSSLRLGTNTCSRLGRTPTPLNHNNCGASVPPAAFQNLPGWSCDSSIGIARGCGLDGRGSISGKGKNSSVFHSI